MTFDEIFSSLTHQERTSFIFLELPINKSTLHLKILVSLIYKKMTFDEIFSSLTPKEYTSLIYLVLPKI